MTTIQLDAAGWCSALDFYDALLAGLLAPDWHGRNIDALINSMIVGAINKVEAPYRVAITGLQSATREAREELTVAMEALAEEGAMCSTTTDEAIIEITTQQVRLQDGLETGF